MTDTYTPPPVPQPQPGQPLPPNSVGAPGTPLIPQTPSVPDTRPGGPPARTLEAERLAQLEQTLAQLQQQQQNTVQEAMGAKETKRDAETRLTEIETALATSQRELALAKLAGQAASIGARNPELVARTVAGEQNPLAAIEALKVSDPYLFGAPRAAGVDMQPNQPAATGLDAFDKHIRDKFGGPAVPG